MVNHYLTRDANGNKIIINSKNTTADSTAIEQGDAINYENTLVAQKLNILADKDVLSSYWKDILRKAAQILNSDAK